MIDTSLPPALFDLDDQAERPLWDRPRWDHIPCHICGQPLTKWVRLNIGAYADGWYDWELMEQAWIHMRTHWTTMRLLAIINGPIRNGHPQ